MNSITHNQITKLGFSDLLDSFKSSEITILSNFEIPQFIDNPITKLPIWICDFPNMEIQWNSQWSENFITFDDNPIENIPIEIIQQGKEAIKNYFAELEKGTINLYETKLYLTVTTNLIEQNTLI